ncbi:MAG TPA: 2-phosphosulfolactate phosphatase, partial [Clostridia bacterium]|nr:2-phosphosulfolactate phosphatase [Clostridia bacterium]
MQITTYPFPQAITEKHFYGKTAIVVDVLRATTSIVEALKNGATQVITARD